MFPKSSSPQRSYIAIDLKSFYASVECVERGLDPLTTNLVVADVSRTEKTICLAVTPSLKAYGISGRARLFEVIQKLREVNRERVLASPAGRFTGKSVYDLQLKAHPEWAVDYIAAPPRMALYLDYSTRIYQIYLRYIGSEDIHVYSIDEVFMDVTDYLWTYKKTPHELAMTMIRDVLRETGITATAGIGTNLYLSKIAMDIVAKKMPADKDGVRIAELDEMSYRTQLWNHKPMTSFWRIGGGIARRLEYYGIDTMGKLARCSVEREEMLYKLFGVNAELLIDHAWGWEPCTIEAIKKYHPVAHSLSSGQVLTCAYDVPKARVVIHEMADMLALDLVAKRVVTDQVTVGVSYDTESLTNPAIREQYDGPIAYDHYDRQVPKHVHGSVHLPCRTSSSRMIIAAVLEIYDRIVNPILLVRRLNITVSHVVSEEYEKEHREPIQLDLFTDYEELMRRKRAEKQALDKERRMQLALLKIKGKYGKNAILKGLNFEEGATAKIRNSQIGGHKA